MVNGVFFLYKLVGMIFYDCVMKIRKLLKIKKVGYMGIFDLEVLGVLLICVGWVIKIVEYVIDKLKMYDVEIIFGFFILIEDQMGEIVSVKFVKELINEMDIKVVLDELKGLQE